MTVVAGITGGLSIMGSAFVVQRFFGGESGRLAL